MFEKKCSRSIEKRLPVEADSGRLVLLILFSRTPIFDEFGAEITKVRVQKEKKNFKNYSGHIILFSLNLVTSEKKVVMQRFIPIV